MEAQGTRPKRSCRKDQDQEDFTLPQPQQPAGRRNAEIDDLDQARGQDKDGGGDGIRNDIQRMVGNIVQDMQHEMMGQLRDMVTNIVQQTIPDRNARDRLHGNRMRETDECTEEDLRSDRSECSRFGPDRNQRQRQGYSTAKLPPFNGKESWEVWFNRFRDVARLKRWRNEDKLGELLPRLQGAAGDFVYGQLPPPVRSNYGQLIEELNNRFRVAETRKTYKAKFGNHC